MFNIFKKTSVDSIMSEFTSKIDQLKRLSAIHHNDSLNKEDIALELMEESKQSLAESERAFAIAKNLETMVLGGLV